MVNSSDTLSPPQPPSRVYYSLGRMLGVEDFQADQDYHRGRLARALLQLCGTGTVSGLKVRVPQQWQANSPYAPWSFVIASNQNVQVNAAAAGTSGNTAPAFTAGLGATTADGTLTWTNEGPILESGWRANTPFTYPAAVVDQNGNVQVLKVVAGLTTGPTLPQWNANIGGATADGGVTVAWTCLGSAALEVQVTEGVAVDRAGRIIEVPRAVCVPIADWLAAQTASDLNAALKGTNVVIDVFATFVGCTRGVTPCFATQDDYDATDAFSPNRLLDSFAMQLVLRTDASPKLPQDPWLAIGPAATAPNLPKLQEQILEANSGPGTAAPFGSGGTPVEYPPNFDATSVFLARLTIPASPVAGSAPTLTLDTIGIDNFSRLFLYSSSLVARTSGLSSGAES